MSPAEQEVQREQAIAMIDQRISSIQLQQRFTIERRVGGNDRDVKGRTNRNSDVEAQLPNTARFGHAQLP
ncbi:MAG: hypothetical protein ACJ0GY_09060 [Synechococcus sp.]